MPITRLSTDLERRALREPRREPSKVAGVNDKRRVETGGGGGGGPVGSTAGRIAQKAYAARKRGTSARPVVLAHQIMTAPVQSVSYTQTIEAVRAFQLQSGFRHLPVVDQYGSLVGLLTDRDLLRGFRPENAEAGPIPPTSSVMKLMQTQIITATPDTELRDIAQVMVNDGVRCVPVVDGEDLLGIITGTDVLKCVVATGTLDGWL